MQTIFWIMSIVAIGFSTVVANVRRIVAARSSSAISISIGIFYTKKFKGKILIGIAVVSVAWLLAVLSMLAYQRRYDMGKQEIESGDWTGELTIVDTHKKGVFIVRGDDEEYRYKTDNMYAPGSQLWVIGKVQREAPPLWRSSGKKVKTPLINGEMDRSQRLRMRGLHGTITPKKEIRIGEKNLPDI